jgi:hypothetical protein
VARQRQRRADDCHASRPFRDGAHAVPIDWRTASRRVIHDHRQVRDPHEPHESVVWFASVSRPHHKLVGRRQAEGGDAGYLQR